MKHPKRTHHTPPEVNDLGDAYDVDTLRRDGARRRLALRAGGCRTYTWTQRVGRMQILCLCCGLASANPHDIQQLYCGLCSEYHSEWRDDSDEVWQNGAWVRPGGVRSPHARG